jgi:hypothetical protein
MVNLVCELSKCMDVANVAAYKEMIKIIRFVLDTRDSCLNLRSNLEDENLDLEVYSDIDWAGYVENRIIVTGFIIYLLRAPICSRSKGQKGATLSSSETEYVGMLEAVKEVRFIFYLSRDLGISVKLLIMGRTENIGTMFMAENASSVVKTRHIDTRYHVIR